MKNVGSSGVHLNATVRDERGIEKDKETIRQCNPWTALGNKSRKRGPEQDSKPG